MKCPKNPSLYHRTKIRPGERIITNVVFEEDDTLIFSTTFKNVAIGLTVNRDDLGEPTTERVDEFYNHCMNKMSNKHFPMNKNKCDYVKTTYGK